MENKTARIAAESTEGFIAKVEAYDGYCYLIAKCNFDGKVDTEGAEGTMLAAMRRDEAFFATEEDCRKACEAKQRKIIEIIKVRFEAKLERV